MTNITSERVIGLSENPLRFYNDVDLEGVQIPEEPREFREFMDQEKMLDLLEFSNVVDTTNLTDAVDAIHGAFINYSHLEKEP